MKESYLIPKVLYERMMKSPKVSKSMGTPNKVTTRLKTFIPPSIHKSVKNPPLQELLSMAFPTAKLPYAQQFVEYLKKSDAVKWDSNGNLFPPFDNLNIVDVINTLANVNKTLDDEDVDKYKLLLQAINMPDRGIRNKSAQKKLKGGGGGGGDGGSGKKKKKRTAGEESKNIRRSYMLNSVGECRMKKATAKTCDPSAIRWSYYC